MPRILAFFLGFSLTASLCLAQTTQGNYVQRGMASQELQAGGLSAGHPSLPVGSKAKVTNVATGREIEVTITTRVPPSASRIIDLSSGSALALGLGFGGEVIVSAFYQPPQTAPASPQPIPTISNANEPEPIIAEVILEPKPADRPGPTAAAPAPVAQGQPQQPVNINVYNYVGSSAEPAPSPPAPPPPPAPPAAPPAAPIHAVDLSPPVSPPPTAAPPAAAPPAVVGPAPTAPPADPVYAFEPPPAPPEPLAAVELPPPYPYAAVPALPAVSVYAFELPPTPPPAPLPAPPPALPPSATGYSSLYDTPPVSEVLILPGLPDPYCDRLYQLQVGAFSKVESATRALKQLQAAGFDAIQELTGTNLYRVFATGIPADRVHDAAQRLGSIGFSQVWVRE